MGNLGKESNFNEKIHKYVDERDNYGEQSLRKRLKGQVTSKMRTLMIGTLAQIEKFLGADWGHGLTDDKCNDDQIDKRAVWKRLRESILDFGNNQIRAAEKEIDKYKVDKSYLNKGSK